MSKLHATMPNSTRKYYGTVIELSTEDGRSASFVVWVNSISKDGFPSKREYDYIGQDGKPYIRYEDDDTDEYEICDDHYETQTAFDICEKIVEALEGMEV